MSARRRQILVSRLLGWPVTGILLAAILAVGVSRHAETSLGLATALDHEQSSDSSDLFDAVSGLDLRAASVASGGASSNADYTIYTSIGQAAVGLSANGEFAAKAGFLIPVVSLFTDGFESGDASVWGACASCLIAK